MKKTEEKKKKTKVLFDINHPAHVHFFKNSIFQLKEKGFDVYVSSTTKEISEELLNKYNIQYTNIGAYRKGLFFKFVDFIIIGLRFIFFVRKIKPDYILSISSARPFGTLVSKAKFYVFTDTEHATEQIKLFKPFATKIFTPDCFKSDLGMKQVRYNGYHELAYLHPNWFTPNPEVLKEVGLTENDTFFILRFVSWDATHDIGQQGLSIENKRKLIEKLKTYGKIIISSEKKLPIEFEEYSMKICPTKMHNLLYYTTLFIGEGATMASECAVLGTPAIYINSLDAGTLQEQTNLGLIYSFRTDNEVIELVEEMFVNNKLNKEQARKSSKKFILDKVDVTKFIISLVENLR